MKPRGALSDGQTRTLLALLHLHRAHGRATIRGIAGLNGQAYTSVYRQLGSLRRRGLVDWDDDGKATLRPTCTAAPHCEHAYVGPATLRCDNESGPGGAPTPPGRGRHLQGGADMAGHYPGDAAPDHGAA